MMYDRKHVLAKVDESLTLVPDNVPSDRYVKHQKKQ